MAWQGYVDNLKQGGLVLAGVYGKDGNIWAQSPETKASAQEIAAIVGPMQSGQGFPNGIHIGGNKYTVIRADDKDLTAKCSSAENESEKYLVQVSIAKQCVIVGGMCGAAERGACKIVENMRDYLAESGY